MTYNQNDDIKYLRERLKVHENRVYQMILVCAAGYSAVLGFSDKIALEAIPIILFTLFMITENIHYNQLKHASFINQLLILLW